MSSLVFWGGPGWDAATVYLYIAAGCIASFLSFVAVRCKDERQALFFYSIATLVVVMFKAYCVSGADVRFGGGYYQNFVSGDSFASFRDKTIEFGFMLLTIAVRQLTSQYEIYLTIVAVISVLPAMYVFWKERERINLPFAVSGYSIAFLVTGMSAMRQFMAVGVCMLVVYFFYRKKYTQTTLALIAAISLHFSSLCILLFLLLAKVQNRRGLQIAIVAAAVAIGVVAQAAIASLFTGRYSAYSVSDTFGFGSAVLLKYIPLIFFLLTVQLHIGENQTEDKRVSERFSSCWTALLFAISIALIGYIIPIFGRAESFSLPLIVAIAYLIKVCECERYFRVPAKILVFGYFCFRLLLYMNDAYLSEGLMPYIGWF